MNALILVVGLAAYAFVGVVVGVVYGKRTSGDDAGQVTLGVFWPITLLVYVGMVVADKINKVLP